MTCVGVGAPEEVARTGVSADAPDAGGVGATGPPEGRARRVVAVVTEAVPLAPAPQPPATVAKPPSPALQPRDR